MSNHDLYIQPIRCADCPTGISVTLRVLPEAADVQADFIEQLHLDGWAVLDRAPLCPACAETRRIAKAVAE
ncbi:MAG: hypothetical protein QG671_1606 [Actinomycetota bacterium]|nr:hypothetical protein [Actinomycetota bacterium]